MISAPNGCQFSTSTCKRDLINAGFTEEQAKALVKYFEQLYKTGKSE